MKEDQFLKLALPFDEVLERLRQGIADAGLLLIHEINPQAILQQHGFNVQPVRQLLFFHPMAMNTLMTTAPAAILEAPLKVVVLSTGPATTSIFWRNPTATIGTYTGLTALADGLQRQLDAVLAAVHAVPQVH